MWQYHVIKSPSSPRSSDRYDHPPKEVQMTILHQSQSHHSESQQSTLPAIRIETPSHRPLSIPDPFGTVAIASIVSTNSKLTISSHPQTARRRVHRARRPREDADNEAQARYQKGRAKLSGNVERRGILVTISETSSRVWLALATPRTESEGGMLVRGTMNGKQRGRADGVCDAAGQGGGGY